jgi:hypothetical protein
MPVVVLVASSIRSEDRHCNPAGSVTPMSVTTTTCAHSVVSFELEVCFFVTLLQGVPIYAIKAVLTWTPQCMWTVALLRMRSLGQH